MNDDLLKRTAEVVRAVPDQQRFTLSMALACCGADINLAKSQDAIQQLQRLLDWRSQQQGPPIFSFDADSISKRAEIVASNVMRLPDWKMVSTYHFASTSTSAQSLDLDVIMRREGTPLNKAELLRIVGAKDEEARGGKLNMRIGRFIKKMDQAKRDSKAFIAISTDRTGVGVPGELPHHQLPPLHPVPPQQGNQLPALTHPTLQTINYPPPINNIYSNNEGTPLNEVSPLSKGSYWTTDSSSRQSSSSHEEETKASESASTTDSS